jgi:sulfotransferase family protein
VIRSVLSAVLRRSGPPGGGEQLDPRFARPRTLFFGIGAQKAATSWLDHYLRGHPEICLPLHKEQHYWTTLRLPGASNWRARVAGELRKIEDRGPLRLLLRSPDRRERDRAWVLSDAMLRGPTPGHRAYANVLFQAWRGQPVVGEITPAYALLPSSVFTEMAGLGRDVRFVFIMRDPVTRLVSALRMNARRRGDSAGTLPEQLAEALRDPSDMLVRRSCYDLTIRQLEAAVSPERIAYFFYETLFRQAEMDRLCDFLGVARRPAEFKRKVHADPVAADPLQREVEAQAMEVLAPTYEFVRQWFGERVPAKWLTSGGE